MKLSDIGDCEINTIALATKSTGSISVPSVLRVMHFVEHSSATFLDGTFSVGCVEESYRSLGSALLRMTIPEDSTWEQSPGIMDCPQVRNCPVFAGISLEYACVRCTRLGPGSMSIAYGEQPRVKIVRHHSQPRAP